MDLGERWTDIVRSRATDVMDPKGGARPSLAGSCSAAIAMSSIETPFSCAAPVQRFIISKWLYSILPFRLTQFVIIRHFHTEYVT